MAEGLAQKWLDEHDCTGWLAVSAGISAFVGAPTSPETVQALSRHDVTYDGKSKPMTEEMAREAKIVVCMSEHHLAVAGRYSEHAELLDPRGDIADPIGQEQSVYDALADQMEQLIADKLHALIQEGA